jgi:hypothetical protein
MEENYKSVDGVIEKLAIISEAVETLFPEGKSAVVFQLNNEDFKKVQSNFREIDRTHKKFKIDISGVEFIFLEETSLTDETNTVSDNQD